MKQIDLDDLPPKAAKLFLNLAEGEELAVVQGGALIARLAVAAAPPPPDPLANLPPEEGMVEVMEQFKAMIEDEF